MWRLATFFTIRTLTEHWTRQRQVPTREVHSQHGWRTLTIVFGEKCSCTWLEVDDFPLDSRTEVPHGSRYALPMWASCVWTAQDLLQLKDRYILLISLCFRGCKPLKLQSFFQKQTDAFILEPGVWSSAAMSHFHKMLPIPKFCVKTELSRPSTDDLGQDAQTQYLWWSKNPFVNSFEYIINHIQPFHLLQGPGDTNKPTQENWRTTQWKEKLKANPNLRHLFCWVELSMIKTWFGWP